MKQKNKLDAAFGPAGSVMGVVLFIAGGIMMYYSLIGIALVGIGSFIGFTKTHSVIDVKNKRVKFVNNFCGIFPYGNWIQVKPEMSLKVTKSQKGYSTMTRGNAHEFNMKDYRVVLLDSNKQKIQDLYKSESLEKVKAKQLTLKDQLQIETLN